MRYLKVNARLRGRAAVVTTEVSSIEVVSPTDLGHAYLDLHNRMRRMLDDAMTEAGASLSRIKVLGQLAQRGPVNQSTLASCLGFAPRSVTDTVDALVRDGLAIRSSDPRDRRAWLIEITPAGTKALARGLEVKHQIMDQIFSTLDGPTRAEFAATLKSIANSITTSSGACFD